MDRRQSDGFGNTVYQDIIKVDSLDIREKVSSVSIGEDQFSKFSINTDYLNNVPIKIDKKRF